MAYDLIFGKIGINWSRGDGRLSTDDSPSTTMGKIMRDGFDLTMSAQEGDLAYHRKTFGNEKLIVSKLPVLAQAWIEKTIRRGGIPTIGIKYITELSFEGKKASPDEKLSRMSAIASYLVSKNENHRYDVKVYSTMDETDDPWFQPEQKIVFDGIDLAPTAQEAQIAYRGSYGDEKLIPSKLSTPVQKLLDKTIKGEGGWGIPVIAMKLLMEMSLTGQKPTENTKLNRLSAISTYLRSNRVSVYSENSLGGRWFTSDTVKSVFAR